MSTVTASCPGDVLSSDTDRAVIEEDGDDWSSDDDYEEIDPTTRQPPEFEYNSEFQVCCSSVLTSLGAAPRLWNNLPLAMCATDSLSSFKKQLKTLLFKRAFSL